MACLGAWSHLLLIGSNDDLSVVKKLIELDMTLGKQAMMKAVEADKKRQEEALSVLRTVNHER